MPAPTPIIILINAGAASCDTPCRSVGDAAASLSIIRGPGLRLIGLGVVCMWVFIVLARSGCCPQSFMQLHTSKSSGQMAVDVDLKWLWSSSGCGYLMS